MRALGVTTWSQAQAAAGNPIKALLKVLGYEARECDLHNVALGRWTTWTRVECTAVH